MQFRIQADNCMGSGECVLAAPQTFELPDDGVAAVRRDAQLVPPDRARAIVAGCPGSAIELVAEGDTSD